MRRCACSVRNTRTDSFAAPRMICRARVPVSCNCRIFLVTYKNYRSTYDTGASALFPCPHRQRAQVSIRRAFDRSEARTAPSPECALSAVGIIRRTMPREKKPPDLVVSNEPPPYEPVELNIGHRIKEQRERLGLNFEQLSALTAWCDYGGKGPGIAAVTLRRYEREGANSTLPGLRELRILCATFEVSADRLLLDAKPQPYEEQDRVDWEALKDILQRVAKPAEARVPFYESPDPNAPYFREERLRLARLRIRPDTLQPEPSAPS